jgi:ribonuclease P protein component
VLFLLRAADRVKRLCFGLSGSLNSAVEYLRGDINRFPMRYRAGKTLRIKCRREISRLFERGQRAWDRRVTLLALRREGDNMPSRLAVGVSRRHGKAVARNRIKRLCREAFRLTASQLPAGWDYMMVARVGGEFTLRGLQESLCALAARVTGAGERKAASHED